ncbi:MAG TPA: DNA topoisomerase, partial [Kofleriaceae bacterium]
MTKKQTPPAKKKPAAAKGAGKAKAAPAKKPEPAKAAKKPEHAKAAKKPEPAKAAAHAKAPAAKTDGKKGDKKADKAAAKKPVKGAKPSKATGKTSDDGEEEPKIVRAKKIKPGSALVVVESPAKARTINKYLGANYIVKASVGHVRDIPKKPRFKGDIGIDLEDGSFAAAYEVIDGKKKVLADIRRAAAQTETVYLASDPDREGEAIAWHVAEEIKDVNTNLKRVLINEITKKGVTAAIAAPRAIDMDKTNAQQARRILDRIVGYKISPILWNKVQRGLSAGRVQSVAVRLVCEREEEIKAFKPEEY